MSVSVDSWLSEFVGMKWMEKSYFWLLRYFLGLSDIYQKRKGKKWSRTYHEKPNEVKNIQWTKNKIPSHHQGSHMDSLPFSACS